MKDTMSAEHLGSGSVYQDGLDPTVHTVRLVYYEIFEIPVLGSNITIWITI